MANPKYWERDWKHKLDKSFKAKIAKLLEIIPENVKTLVDIGCGNGVITNELGKHFDVTGVDRSEKGLKSVKTKKIKSSCEKIPLKDNSFDLVLTSELLEHLEDDLFYGAVSEIKRLTKKYVLITVPNNENVNKKLVQCPFCKNIFNKTYHLRTLNIQIIKALFSELNIIRYFTFSDKVRGYNRILEKIKHKYSPSNSWIPPYWTKKGGRSTLCPKCSKEFEIDYKFHFVSFICDILNIFLSPKRRYQLFVLLQDK